jgi:thioredoxin 1
MQKNMTKAIGVFTLLLYVLSMTGAAATCTTCKANPDTFSFSPSKYSGNVLSNDKGTGIKVVSVSKTTNGGKVTMKSNGIFSYKPASSSKTTIRDTFTYKIKSKCGQYSTAKVTINYKKTQGSTGTGSTGTVVEVTQLEQINTALQKGPVFLKLGAEWCAYCQKMKPIMQEMATEYKGKATIMSADVDKSPKLADYFGVSSMPDSCVIVGVQNGQYVYMKQNGQVTTDKSQATIIGLYSKGVFEKVINLALQQ